MHAEMVFQSRFLLIACAIMLALFTTTIMGSPQKRATGGMPHFLHDLAHDQAAQDLDALLANATLSSSTGLLQVVSLLERLLSQNQQMVASMSTLAKGLHLTAGDCSDVVAQGPYASGIYEITPWDDLGFKGAFEAYCDMTDNTGWTVIQRRLDGSVDFFRGWEEYKNGFGDLDGEFWLGLNKMYRLTSKSKITWQLRVELEDFSRNTVYADYDSFSIGDESTKFQLTLGAYSGTAGDSLRYHRNAAFSTKDRDNDVTSTDCAATRRGGWWYRSCEDSNLNGPYIASATSTSQAITWYHWKNRRVALKKSQMKIRPTE